MNEATEMKLLTEMVMLKKKKTPLTERFDHISVLSRSG